MPTIELPTNSPGAFLLTVLLRMPRFHDGTLQHPPTSDQFATIGLADEAQFDDAVNELVDAKALELSAPAGAPADAPKTVWKLLTLTEPAIMPTATPVPLTPTADTPEPPVPENPVAPPVHSPAALTEPAPVVPPAPAAPVAPVAPTPVVNNAPAPATPAEMAAEAAKAKETPKP